LSYLANRQTDKQTNRQTKTGKNITSLAEVNSAFGTRNNMLNFTLVEKSAKLFYNVQSIYVLTLWRVNFIPDACYRYNIRSYAWQQTVVWWSCTSQDVNWLSTFKFQRRWSKHCSSCACACSAHVQWNVFRSACHAASLHASVADCSPITISELVWRDPVRWPRSCSFAAIFRACFSPVNCHSAADAWARYQLFSHGLNAELTFIVSLQLC